ncbi:MAG TPA: enoyl-CoA hydratase/isomerase family protein [Vicinamibacterales bacterium]|jgi:cyclohexa-1,5-dienecarbonyl-CoA hydratase|nr:enoyl-CoA hydratase/isomerase family protein [Vicinamibacterales bacterium]
MTEILRLEIPPSKGNLITAAAVKTLRGSLESAASASGLKLIALEGKGPDFSFGASVPEHAPGEIDRVLPQMHQLIFDLLDAPAPTAAIVRGRCLGGGFELVLACDFIFAAEDAVLGLPEIKLGVFPPAGAALLPPRVGASRASRAILTGETRPAAEWHAAGLITLVAPAARLAAEFERWFHTHIRPHSAAALRYAAKAARLPLREEVSRTLPALERLYLDHLMRTADAAEGVAAFTEKRAPRWTNT